MTLLGWIVAIIFTAGVVVAGCVALANDDDEDGFGGVRVVQLASHEGDCWDGECYGGGGGQNYEDQWSNEDRNRNRNRNRGAFSPGPFDDSPVDAFNGNVVCLPGAQCYADRQGQEPPPEEPR